MNVDIFRMIYAMPKTGSEQQAVKVIAFSFSEPLVSHLMMVLCFSDNDSKMHWKGEINAFLKKIISYRIGNKKKPLSKKGYKKALWDEEWDDNAIRRASIFFKHKFGKPVSVEELKSKTEPAVSRLCEYLHEDDIEGLYTYIENL
jgi:hypothetical protein